MLTGIYIGLRFVHFLSLMVAFGCVLYGAWWAPVTLRRLLMQRFFRYCAIFCCSARSLRC
jgi:putative copper resistance protein D